MTRILLLIPLACGLGILSFGLAGIAVARMTGIGRFYSIPFGMMTVKESDLILSVLFWIAFWLAILTLIFRKRRADDEPSSGQP